ncbi:Uncharacterised protein [Mycobacteroides abscessus subsp. abscessus]|nr:Uncharacterised protein [Mycobacteroides abscessus subsp. abscessus]
MTIGTPSIARDKIAVSGAISGNRTIEVVASMMVKLMTKIQPTINPIVDLRATSGSFAAENR